MTLHASSNRFLPMSLTPPAISWQAQLNDAQNRGASIKAVYFSPKTYPLALSNFFQSVSLPASKILPPHQLSPQMSFNKLTNWKKIGTAQGSGTTPGNLPLLFPCSPKHGQGHHQNKTDQNHTPLLYPLLS
jgi:hypothetical protein